MTIHSGNLRKLKGMLASPVEYELALSDQNFPLSPLIGSSLRLSYLGLIHCVQCGRKTNKSFQQGHCFPCMQRLNECGNCVIFPERCRVETGQCPADDWAHRQCNQPHIVYLANASGLKVGITRSTQVPTRWIDQGAKQALPIFEVSNRYQAGILEVALKEYVSDRTNWRAMLKNTSLPMDLLVERDRLLLEAKASIATVLQKFPKGAIRSIDTEKPVHIDYPVNLYPTKVVSLSLEKQPSITGELQGIKGQYLLFDIGVLNIRKFGGYLVEYEEL